MTDAAGRYAFQLDEIARRLARLDPDKQRRFLDQLGARGIDVGQLPIPRLDRMRAPLSFAQSRFWFLWRMNPGSGAYAMPAALRLRGALDRAALQVAFDALVRRHETLRTVFAQGDGPPEQVVREPFAVTIRECDLSGPDQETEALMAARAEAEAPFDLETGPLLRVALIRRGVDDHVLLVTMHHIVSDGWSMGVIVDEFWRLYADAAQGRPAELPSMDIQYADYGAWQRVCLASAEGERQLAYWTGRLRDEALPLQLPFDRARRPEPDFRGAGLTVRLDPDLTASLRDLARDRGTTLFSVLLAGFAALLHRYGGQNDIRIGVPVANRSRAGTRGLVGPLTNTVVLRTAVEGRDPAALLLSRVHAAALEAQDHQDVPFERLVEALHPERSLSDHPLFQVVFNHQRPHAMPATVAGLTVEPFPLVFGTAKFDLALDTREEAEGSLSGLFTYATSLFDEDTVARMAAHWVAILRAFAAEPDQRVGEIRLPLAAGDAPPEAGRAIAEIPVHAAFAEHARKHPEAEAVRFGAESLSYADLDARANRLAHALAASGIGPGAIVGVALSRTPALVIALLAVLKAGAAYTPLDPATPASRVTEALADAGAALLLADDALLARLPDPGRPVLNPGAVDLAAWPDGDLETVVHPEALAYVIYTSGSTGRPKGVAVAHGPDSAARSRSAGRKTGTSVVSAASAPARTSRIPASAIIAESRSGGLRGSSGT
nr:condensation domain-containing protein [Methylobacterium aquaticum]